MKPIINIHIFAILTLHSLILNKIIKQANMERRLWNSDEDQTISRLVSQYGNKKWTVIAEKLNEKYEGFNRSGKQCRERWHNHLDPSINKETWSLQEENTLFRAHQKYGNRWKQISKLLVGRTDNSIKNHFYSTLRRSLRRLNKYLGSKNSTSQMREVKPSVLSQILQYAGNETDEFSNQNQKLASQNAKNLPWLIFSFSEFKPAKNRNRLILQSKQIALVEEIMAKINQFNQLYEQKQTAKKQNRRKLLKKISKQQLQIGYIITKQQLIQSKKNRQSIQFSQKRVRKPDDENCINYMSEEGQKNVYHDEDMMHDKEQHIDHYGSLSQQQNQDDNKRMGIQYDKGEQQELKEMQLMHQVNPPSDISQNIDGLCFRDNLIVYGTQLKLSDCYNGHYHDLKQERHERNKQRAMSHKQSQEYIEQILEINYDSHARQGLL